MNQSEFNKRYFPLHLSAASYIRFLWYSMEAGLPLPEQATGCFRGEGFGLVDQIAKYMKSGEQAFSLSRRVFSFLSGLPLEGLRELAVPYEHFWIQLDPGCFSLYHSGVEMFDCIGMLVSKIPRGNYDKKESIQRALPADSEEDKAYIEENLYSVTGYYKHKGICSHAMRSMLDTAEKERPDGVRELPFGVRMFVGDEIAFIDEWDGVTILPSIIHREMVTDELVDLLYRRITDSDHARFSETRDLEDLRDVISDVEYQKIAARDVSERVIRFGDEEWFDARKMQTRIFFQILAWLDSDRRGDVTAIPAVSTRRLTKVAKRSWEGLQGIESENPIQEAMSQFHHFSPTINRIGPRLDEYIRYLESEGIDMQRHWVRCHWRHYWTGSGRTNLTRKLIFPFVRGNKGTPLPRINTFDIPGDTRHEEA